MRIIAENPRHDKPTLHSRQYNSTHPNQRVPGVASDAPGDHVEVLDMQHTPGRNAVKATCRVRIGPIAIAGCKVVLPVLASRPFVSMPSRKDGDQWQPLVVILSPTLAEAVSVAIMAEWRKGGAR